VLVCTVPLKRNLLVQAVYSRAIGSLCAWVKDDVMYALRARVHCTSAAQVLPMYSTPSKESTFCDFGKTTYYHHGHGTVTSKGIHNA